MGDVMAIPAFGEASQHAGRMRRAVAALAGGHSLVLLFVTGHAGNVLVLCISLAMQIKGLLVACGTHLVRRVGGISDSCRHVGLVTALALCYGHLGAVRFVALCTERDLAMNIVTETASQVGVFALDLLQLDNLLGVAGEALIGDVVGQFDDLGRMRVIVTAQAAGQVVVRFVAVALAAGRDDLFVGRGMPVMTILAADAGFVGAAIGGYSLRGCRVALDAISIGQNRFGVGGSRIDRQQANKQCCRTKGYKHCNHSLHFSSSRVLVFASLNCFIAGMTHKKTPQDIAIIMRLRQ